jgi:hypothetical protein
MACPERSFCHPEGLAPRDLSVIPKGLPRGTFLSSRRACPEGPQKHKWEPSVKIVPISLQLTFISCSARLLLLRPALFPDVPTCVLSQKILPYSLFSGLLQPDFRDVRSIILKEFLPSEISSRTKHPSDTRVAGISATCGCKIFELALYLFPECFFKPELGNYHSAVRLNLPKNTFRWLAFVGTKVLPFVFRLRHLEPAGSPVRSDFRPI